MNDQIFLSSTDTTPMYSQIMDQILAKVLAGDWQRGQALPSIRELAAASRVSVITVKRAYLELERNGVIVTRQGKGSYVADTQDLPRQIAQDAFDAHLIGLLGAAAKLGMPSPTVVDVVRNALSADESAFVPMSAPTQAR
jgi:GntR family transcriptional regulator